MTTQEGQISLSDAAERLGVHYMTVYRYVRTGKLAAVKRAGQWFVDRADVETFTVGSDPGTRDGSRRGSAGQLEARLLAADEPGAWSIVEQTLASGAEPAEIHLRFIIPAMHSIGERWNRGEISVLDEHRATVVANRLTARLGPRFRRRGRSRATIVLGVAAGDPHALTTAILADLLRGEGFAVIDLGGNTPIESFVEALGLEEEILAVGISANIDESREMVTSTISALRALAPDIPVVVGGSSIRDHDDAVTLGADHFAPDAEMALGLFNALNESH